MYILGNGIDYRTRSLLVPAIDENDLPGLILQSMEGKMEENRVMATVTSLRGEMPVSPLPNLADPREAGWTFLVNAADPNYSAILEAIRPLAEHRGMENPAGPLLYNGETNDDWFDWVTDYYSPLAPKKRPLYVLIVGSPQSIPFAFQSMLSSLGAIGRVDFDDPEHPSAFIQKLQIYVDKVLRLEKQPEPAVKPDVIFIGTKGDRTNPVYYSRYYLIDPLVASVPKQGFSTICLVDDKATKDQLSQALRGSKPVLVFTASHGLGARSEPLSFQRRLNGAICFENSQAQEQDWLFTADDIYSDEPYLEGSVFFQFACFGYGTPAKSDYNHWLNKDSTNSQIDFVAALPKRLLSHPRGPISFIGHLDTAFLHGFANPRDLAGPKRWSKRIAPFEKAVQDLLACRPPGLAMREMWSRMNLLNTQIITDYDRIQQGLIRLPFSAEKKQRFVDTFITRSDAQNYMIFGDPAVKIRISTG